MPSRRGSLLHERVLPLYEMAFHERFREAHGNAFEDFFCEVMEHAYPDGDFVRVRPWGSEGDRKNDGYIHTERKLFAVYGPWKPTAAEVCAKVTSDFEGAVPHWQEWFGEFVFMHNDPQGVGPQLMEKILQLDSREEGLAVRQWGRQALKDRALALADERLRQLFPGVPSVDDFFSPSEEHIQRLIDQLARKPVPTASDVTPPPADKIEFNGFSGATEHLIKLGMSPSQTVRELFGKSFFDHTRRDRIAADFTAKYQELRASGYGPDDIYSELKAWAGGVGPKSSEHEVAVYGILTYFFEECDIFLRPERPNDDLAD